MPTTESKWKSVLTLNGDRELIDGSQQELAAAIRRGADLRIQTDFRHDEHLDTSSDNDELVLEVAEFRLTYLLDDTWVAGIMTLRMPIVPPAGFGPRPSHSFFLYNQDARQGIARPFLDGQPRGGEIGPAELDDLSEMPKYHQSDNWDAGTNAPSHNFIYDFGFYRFFVRDDWSEVLSHEADGRVISGSFEELTSAFECGAEIKVAVRGLCADLEKDPATAVQHELLVQTGPSYCHTRQKLLSAGTHPVVRVAAAIPLRYESRNWDFGSLMVRTDGLVARWLTDPYTMAYSKSESRHALRWFVRR